MLACALVAAVPAAKGTVPKDAAGDCGEMNRVTPAKIGDFTLVKKTCSIITPNQAKSLHAYPGRILEASYQALSKRRLSLVFNDVRHDPNLTGVRSNPAIIGQQKSAESKLREAAAKGTPGLAEAYRSLLAHSRVAALSKPDEAVVSWQEDKANPTAEVRGAVLGTTYVMIDMDAKDIDAALATLNQINAAIDYSALR